METCYQATTLAFNVFSLAKFSFLVLKKNFFKAAVGVLRGRQVAKGI